MTNTMLIENNTPYGKILHRFTLSNKSDMLFNTFERFHVSEDFALFQVLIGLLEGFARINRTRWDLETGC